tara:strand:- start:26318 stop:26722 length:405 start_codon:yes stop_codon:yes gene_type:complete
MGCTTCNSNTDKKNSNSKSITFIPDNFGEGPVMENFLLKIVVFVILVAALPIIMLVLVLQIFFTFFTPRYVNKIKSKSHNFFKGILEKFIRLRYKKELLKREQQFKDNPDYIDIDNEELDIEVFKGDNNEEESK